MSAPTTSLSGYLDNTIGSFVRISQSYFSRRDPVGNMIKDTIISVQNFLSTKQRLQALKYRVQLMNYRIYQMEQIMQQNNPYNFKGGSNFNQLR
jgi:hypothetical protein